MAVVVQILIPGCANHTGESMQTPFLPHIRHAIFGSFLLAGICQTGLADDDRRATSGPLLPAYRQECAACHIAYPPDMLPPASWQRIVGNLPHHYGTDASLDPVTVKTLSTWLAANASKRQEAPAEDRITRTRWFVREHDEVPPATWKRPAIKSASNCVACHTRSDQGDFNEHSVRIPR